MLHQIHLSLNNIISQDMTILQKKTSINKVKLISYNSNDDFSYSFQFLFMFPNTVKYMKSMVNILEKQ